MILKNEIYLNLIIISLNFFSIETSTIIFPFKTIPSPYLIGYRTDKNNFNNNNKVTYNSSKFFDDNYIFKLLSLSKLGSPPKNIISSLELFQDNLLIKNYLDISDEIFNKQEIKEYQYKQSSTFKNLTKIWETNNNEYQKCMGEDNLYLFSSIDDMRENKYSRLNNFKFELDNFQKTDSNFHSLSIGLSLDRDNSITNFMRQLYNNKIISSFIISFEYKIKDIIEGYDGILIIGDYPHQLMPDKYKEEDFISFYSNQPNTMFITNFYINFDEIGSINKNKEKFIFNNIRSILKLNSNLITGTIEYLDYIEQNFFGKYYKLKICQRYKTKTEFISEFIIISCDIKNDLKLEEFPNLYFNMKSENLSFEFTYKDLFVEINNKYYFLIIFETKNFIWQIGKSLFLKYTFVYNGEAKTIGFYKKRIGNNNDIESKNNDNNKSWKMEINIWKLFLFIFLFAIFIFLIAFISFRYGKKIHLMRKKHANELDDDNFEYNPNLKYKKFNKDVNEINYNAEEKHLELINKTNV
jgi:hypothetical protein